MPPATVLNFSVFNFPSNPHFPEFTATNSSSEPQSRNNADDHGDRTDRSVISQRVMMSSDSHLFVRTQTASLHFFIYELIRWLIHPFIHSFVHCPTTSCRCLSVVSAVHSRLDALEEKLNSSADVVQGKRSSIHSFTHSLICVEKLWT